MARIEIGKNTRITRIERSISLKSQVNHSLGGGKQQDRNGGKASRRDCIRGPPLRLTESWTSCPDHIIWLTHLV